TDHNVAATLRITDRNYILIDGQIIAQGTGEEIAADPHVRKHYLGQQFGTIDYGPPPESRTEPPKEERGEGEGGQSGG
ncbi:MAG TPA: hypothetical protein VEX38_05675, partial [Fimbriimonadaceae bacterium]|nr:hypothetical protein [Fimbriimonadaceae bacterium]